MVAKYQVIIVGGGPAGLTAGLYTSRSRLSSLLIERGMMGGLIVNSEHVENYPGFPAGISGSDLGELFHRQSIRFGLETLTGQVNGLELNGKEKVIITSEGRFSARAIIISTGSERRKLGVSGEAEFTGRGVSYCATCDAAFFEGLSVAVVGGGDTAITEALHLAKFASRVTLIHRRDQLRASRIMQERALAEPRIDFLWNTVIDRINGGDTVTDLELHNVQTAKKSKLEIAGVFISAGFKPNTEFLSGLVPLDEGGQIAANNRMETAIPGILAAGDVRQDSARQVIAAAGDGATAAIFAERYIAESG